MSTEAVVSMPLDLVKAEEMIAEGMRRTERLITAAARGNPANYSERRLIKSLATIASQAIAELRKQDAALLDFWRVYLTTNTFVSKETIAAYDVARARQQKGE